MTPFGYGVLCGIGGTLGLVGFGTLVLILADKLAQRRARTVRVPGSLQPSQPWPEA